MARAKLATRVGKESDTAQFKAGDAGQGLVMANSIDHSLKGNARMALRDERSMIGLSTVMLFSSGSARG